MKRISIALMLLSNVFWLTTSANLQLPSIFNSNMVLQRNNEVAIWGWAAPGKTISIVSSWNNKKYSIRSDGSGKWKLKISTPDAGGPYQLQISGDGNPVKLDNILIGEVWVCSGQSNMEMPMKGFRGQPIAGSNEAIIHSRNANIRLYTVPRSAQTTPQDTSKTSSWKDANSETVADFSATAYYFGKLLYDMLNVPIGLVNVSYSGSSVEAWMDEASLKQFPEIRVPIKTDTIRAPNRTPTVLYNGMIHPIVGYGMRGMLWYQGESNHDRPDQYELLFPAMVSLLRTLWQAGDFPFYFAQIAPFNYPPITGNPKSNSAFLRDAQRKSVDRIPNSGMAVLLDAGEETNIHPANKKVAGERLAYIALAKTYGQKGFGFVSPSYDSLLITGSIAEVRFKDAASWLTSYGKEMT
ncbi:MAG TPA: sialate O-acetylesterase, partial [Chitinophagaceae bacterium]